ncbi:hypothetical protein LJB98_05190 [Bacteroidales bacterium OttesenSCG-928-M11]|nr:hypothetical protein [Bacteroidales bacterium OttesenSCG-928-M11]
MKRTTMVWAPIIALFSILLPSCSEEDDYYPYYSYDSSIYSDSDKVYMSEMILFIRPYIVENGERKYIITEKIFDLRLKINNFWSGSFDSYFFDLSHLNPQDQNDQYFLSKEAIPYPFSIEISTVPDELLTAGDYSNLLNNRWNLQPGAYITQIQSFYIRTIEGKDILVTTPSLIVPLEIKEGVASVNLGTFDIEIK